MCGRFVLTTPAEALRQAFGFIEQPNLAPRHNIAPTQDRCCAGASCRPGRTALPAAPR